MRKNLDAFAAGVNAYAASHPDKIAPEVKVVLPLSGVDIIASRRRYRPGVNAPKSLVSSMQK